MARSYTYSSRDIEKILKKNGYKYIRTRGGHQMYSNGVHTVPITRNINKMLALRVIKECNLNV